MCEICRISTLFYVFFYMVVWKYYKLKKGINMYQNASTCYGAVVPLEEINSVSAPKQLTIL